MARTKIIGHVHVAKQIDHEGDDQKYRISQVFDTTDHEEMTFAIVISYWPIERLVQRHTQIH